MGDNEIRMFNVDRGRNNDINYAYLCNGRTHFACWDNLSRVSPRVYRENTHCDGVACQGSDSTVVDIKELSIQSQTNLGLATKVPSGVVLVAKGLDAVKNLQVFSYVYGDTVTPKALEEGTLLSDGEGARYIRFNEVYYVRNVAGRAIEQRVGRKSSKRTYKKLAKLRVGERKSDESYDVTQLNERLLELMQLHRTPEVLEAIESIKELLRLASSLSIEASIEAAEGHEQIASELASARALEIGAELELMQQRLLTEKTARDQARKELRE